MSFSGFVFDMIGRDKANKELLRLRRERRKELSGKIGKSGETHPELKVTLAEFERIQRETKEKERQERNYYLRYSCLFLAVMALFALVAWGVMKFL